MSAAPTSHRPDLVDIPFSREDKLESESECVEMRSGEMKWLTGWENRAKWGKSRPAKSGSGSCDLCVTPAPALKSHRAGSREFGTTTMAMEFKDGGFSSFIPAALVYSLPVVGLGLQDNLPSAPARPELIDSCMPRPVRRPSPILLPHHPMDTLWEVDESLDQVPQSRRQLRSVFEDDEEMRSVSFPLPPRSVPPMKRFFSKMSLPMHSPPRTRRSPPKPTRAPPPIPRPVSPSSSASSSDTEPPRTPPAAPAPLPAYVLSPPPPAEWESAIDALFDFDDEEELSSKWSSSSSTPRASPTPIRPTDSYLSFSPPCSPPPMSYMHSAKSPLPPSMSVYASDSLPMSPSFDRPLALPGLVPTSSTPPGLCQWPTVPSRPARSSKRMGTIAVRIQS